MEFAQRGLHQQTANPAPAGTPAGSGKGKKERDSAMWSRLSAVVLLVSAGILIMAVIIFVVTGKIASEQKYINGNQYQAVFLNGGQVYFGKIKTLNDKYLRLDDIYYLRVNQTVQPNQANSAAASNDVSLVKLGCELHGPQDEMLIHNDQIIFWENLKTDGQVAKAVGEYQKQNPNGQKCDATAKTPSTPTPATKP
jgi:hypothetical protein